MIRHIIKQYNISSTELFTEYTLTIKQHKSHAKLQTKIAKKYRQKRRTVHRSEQEPTWQVPLWTLVNNILFKFYLNIVTIKISVRLVEIISVQYIVFFLINKLTIIFFYRQQNGFILYWWYMYKDNLHTCDTRYFWFYFQWLMSGTDWFFVL